MVQKLSTKYKVVIVNVVVIGLLLCGQYWIDQQNQVDLKFIESDNTEFLSEENFNLEEVRKMVDAVKNGKSEKKFVEFEDVDGDNIYSEYDSNSGKFTSYTNGMNDVVNADFNFNKEFYNEFGGKYNVAISGEKPIQNVFYAKPIPTDENNVIEYLKTVQKYEDMNKDLQMLIAETFILGRTYRVTQRVTATHFTDRGKTESKYYDALLYTKGENIKVKDVQLSEKDNKVRVQIEGRDNYWIPVIEFYESGVIRNQWLESIPVDQTKEGEKKLKKLEDQIQQLKKKIQNYYLEKLLNGNFENLSIKFTTVDKVIVQLRYQTARKFGMNANKGQHSYIVVSGTLTKGEFLNNKYSLEIKETWSGKKNFQPFSNFTAKGKDSAYQNAFSKEKKKKETLQQKFDERKIYKVAIQAFTLILVCFLVIFVMFYDEETKVFLFIKNNNELNDSQNKYSQYIQDGAINL